MPICPGCVREVVDCSCDSPPLQRLILAQLEVEVHSDAQLVDGVKTAHVLMTRHGYEGPARSALYWALHRDEPLDATAHFVVAARFAREMLTRELPIEMPRGIRTPATRRELDALAEYIIAAHKMTVRVGWGTDS